jgi:hypothetical protein
MHVQHAASLCYADLVLEFQGSMSSLYARAHHGSSRIETSIAGLLLFSSSFPERNELPSFVHGTRKERNEIYFLVVLTYSRYACRHVSGRGFSGMPPANPPQFNPPRGYSSSHFPFQERCACLSAPSVLFVLLNTHDHIDVEAHTCSPSLDYRPTQLDHGHPKFEQTGGGFACTTLRTAPGYCVVDLSFV